MEGIKEEKGVRKKKVEKEFMEGLREEEKGDEVRTRREERRKTRGE